MHLHNISIFSLFLLFFIHTSCSVDEKQMDPIMPIEFNSSSVLLNYRIHKNQIVIINGNDNYKLSYPEKIHIAEPVDSTTSNLYTWNEYDFPNDKIRAYIEGNTIYFEGKFSEDENYFFAYFLVEDSKNQKALVMVWSPYLGEGPRLDKETEERIMNDLDYWQ